MKQQELNQIKAFINYLSKKQTRVEAKTALEDVIIYLSELELENNHKIDGRSDSWTEERKATHKEFWAKRREDKLHGLEVSKSEKAQAKSDGNKIWFWDYNNEPPTHITRKEAADIVGKAEQVITKAFAQNGDFVAPMPKQLRSVCFTLTNSPQALHGALQQADRSLSNRPKAKK